MSRANTRIESARGGWVYFAISDAAGGHTLDIFIVDPTHCDLVERAATQDLVATTYVMRRKTISYHDRASRTKFVPFAFKTYIS